MFRTSTARSFRFLLTAAAALSLALVTAALAQAKAPYQVEYRENVVCGKAGEEPLTLHLARPIGAPTPAPVVVFIHGGGWRMGNKDTHVREIKQAAEQGFVAASIGYRLAPEHQWPAQIQDCKCAIRWLRANASELGLDPERVGAVGGSAGGHLSMLLGTLDDAPACEGEGGCPEQSSKVQAVVSFFGPSDMVDEYRYSNNARALASLVRATGGGKQRKISVGGESIDGSEAVSALDEAGRTVTDFMGGSPRELKEAYQLASPLHQLDKHDAPMLIFHGTRDLLVPWQQSVAMVERLTAAGVPGRVEIVAGAGHGFDEANQERAVRATLDFFAEQLKLERE